MKKFARIVLSAAAWLAIWEAGALITGEELLLPSPKSVAFALVSLLSTGDFYLSVASSVLRVTAGLFAGIAAGLLVGAGIYFSKILRTFFAPAIGAVKAAPVASFIILLFVWFSTGRVVGITAFLIVLPIVSANVSSALGEAPSDLLEMGRAFGMKKINLLRYIYIPAAKPSFKAALRTGTGMAWKAGIAAEVICRPKTGLGTEIYNAKVYLDTPSLFAWTITVILLSVLFEKLFSLLLSGRKAHD